jgi:hypothetical protein
MPIWLLIALFALTLPAPAQATWQSLGRLSAAEQDASQGQVAVDPNGNAVFVWAHLDGTGSGNTCCLRIEARARSAAGVVSGLQTISDPGQNASQPQVAIDANGNAVFTWVTSDGTNDRVLARTRTAAGTLGAVQTLSAAGQGAEEPQVAVNSGGNAIFVWERSDGSDPANGCCLRVQARTLSAAGALSDVQTISPASQDSFSPEVGVDPNGNAVVAWAASKGNSDFVQARARSAAAILSSVQTLSNKDSYSPEVGVDANGNAVFTWIAFDGADDRVQARARSAAGTLSTVQNLSAVGEYAEQPQVAVDAAGNAIFVWTRFDGTDPLSGCCFLIQARARTAAGTLSAVQTLSGAGQNAFSPQVAMDPNDNAVFDWERSDGTDPPNSCCTRIEARARSAAGILSGLQTLSDPGQNASEAQVGIDANGNAVFSWTRSDGTYKHIQARARSAAGTLSGVDTFTSVGRETTSPQVAVDSSGNAVFGWVAFDGNNDVIEARARSAAGVLSGLQTLSDPGQNASDLQVAVDPNGNAVFVWRRFDGTDPTNGCCFRIEARARSAAGTLSAIDTLSDPGQNASSPQVTVDGGGNAVFAWARFNGANDVIETRARSSGGTLSAVQLLSVVGQNASQPQVSVDPNGNATFAWRRFDGTKNRIQARARSAAGTLSTVQSLSAASQDASQPQVAVDGSGKAVFVWSVFNGTNDIIQARTRSAAGTLSATQALSGGGQNASSPQVAVDGGGNAVFAWVRFNGTNYVIQARMRSAAGTLSSLLPVSAVGQNAEAPQVGIDSSGNSVLVWARSDGTKKRIQARTLSSGGTLAGTQTISVAGQDASVPQVAVDPTGKAFATWQRFDGKKFRVEASVGP